MLMFRAEAETVGDVGVTAADDGICGSAVTAVEK